MHLFAIWLHDASIKIEKSREEKKIAVMSVKTSDEWASLEINLNVQSMKCRYIMMHYLTSNAHK